MHEVRVHHNVDSTAGTTWWADDGLGLAGGADTLIELKHIIWEWIDAEGVDPETVRMRLVVGLPEESGPDEDTSRGDQGQGPTSGGSDAVITGVALQPARA